MMKNGNTDINRQASYVPPQYRDGETVFLGKRIMLTPDVFIPRPETERLVQKAADLLSKLPSDEPKVLDLCTGSGAVAISLASSFVGAQVTAVDISDKALEVAKQNVKAHSMTGRIKIFQSNLYENLEKGFFSEFDLIVSNPPYVSDDGYKYFTDAWSRQEPQQALKGGPDGLNVLRSIIRGAKEHLTPFGYLVLEIGFDQARRVKELLRSCQFSNITSCYDHNGYERIVWGSADG